MTMLPLRGVPRHQVLNTFSIAVIVLAIASFTILGSRGAILYVSVDSAHPSAPYATWETAAQTIQDAVDGSTNGDLVLVTNGVYRTGGSEHLGTNRVAILKPIVVQSVNGPEQTVIEGYQMPGTINGSDAIRCVYLAAGASLNGFTLTNGATTETYYWGGGVACESMFGNETVSNCVIINNSAFYDSGGGDGGAYYNCKFINNRAASNGGASLGSYMFNCLLANNYAGQGGGTHSCLIDGCVVVGNTAGDGAGSYNGRSQDSLIVSNVASGVFGGGGTRGTTLINCTVAYNVYNGAFLPKIGGTLGSACYNCIVYFNTPKNYSGGSFVNSCFTPATNGDFNFTVPPLFVNAAAGDFHLQTNSPCINSGNRGFNEAFSAFSTPDGNARFVGAVDVGAYELQSSPSLLSYYWAQQYGLATDGSADFLDNDGDGMNNYQECVAGTQPLDASSVLKLLPPVRTNIDSGFVLNWQGVSGKTYYLQRAVGLLQPLAFTNIQTGISGPTGTLTTTDSDATNDGPYFYRVGVQ